MKYFSSNAARKLLANDDFNRRFCRILRTLAFINGNDVVRRTARSAEDEYLYQEKLKGSKDWCIRETIRLSRDYAENGRFLFRFIDKENEIDKEEALDGY